LAALLHSVFCKKNVPKYLNFANFLKNYFLYRTAQEGESRNNASAILIYSYVLREVLTSVTIRCAWFLVCLIRERLTCWVIKEACKLVLLLKGGGLRTQKTFLGLAVGKRVETSDN
jgi:hypothetical protein